MFEDHQEHQQDGNENGDTQGDPKIEAARLAAGHEDVLVIKIDAVDRLGGAAHGGLEILVDFPQHATDGHLRWAGETFLAAFDARDHSAIGLGDVGFDVDAGVSGFVDQREPGDVFVFDFVVFGFGDGLVGVKLAGDGDVAVEEFLGGDGVGDGGFDRIALVGFDFDGLVDGENQEDAEEDEEEPVHGDTVAASAAGAFGEGGGKAQEAVGEVHESIKKGRCRRDKRSVHKAHQDRTKIFVEFVEPSFQILWRDLFCGGGGR